MAYSLNDSKIKEALKEDRENERYFAFTYLNKRVFDAEMQRDVIHDDEAYNNIMTEIRGGLKLMTHLCLITEEERKIIEVEYIKGKVVPPDKETFQKAFGKRLENAERDV